MPSEFPPSLFSTKVHNGRRTIFFDVKATKEDKPYIKITESSISKEGEKKRNYMTIFDNEMNEFRSALDQSLGFINKQ